MIGTVLWFARFGLYLFWAMLKAIKLHMLRKSGNMKAYNEYLEKTVKNWAHFVIRSTGAEIEVIGKKNIPEGAFLFVGNHQGYLDIPVVLSQFKGLTGFVAKKELEKAPVLSTWMKEFHCVFMDRDNVREAVKSINEAVEYLKQGQPMVIFPEGTRSKSDKLGEFKKGSLKLALKAEVPIIPLTISGTYKTFEETGRISKAKVKVIVGEPIYINRLTREEQNNLTGIIRDTIQNNLNSLNKV